MFKINKSALPGTFLLLSLLAMVVLFFFLCRSSKSPVSTGTPVSGTKVQGTGSPTPSTGTQQPVVTSQVKSTPPTSTTEPVAKAATSAPVTETPPIPVPTHSNTNLTNAPVTSQ